MTNELIHYYRPTAPVKTAGSFCSCGLACLLLFPCLSGAATNPVSFAYVLQAENLAPSRQEVVSILKDCKRDWIVMDRTADSSTGDWTRSELDIIRKAHPGRKIICYLSIGEAEDYRPYWKKEWDADKDGIPDKAAPAFLAKVNPDWVGNYKVRYWQKDWQDIILRQADLIVKAGFDGLYLDIVDAFEFYEFDITTKDWIDNRVNPETGSSYRNDMIRWIQQLADHCRKVVPEFLIIPQNGSQLFSMPEMLSCISGAGMESVFTEGNRIRKSKETQERLQHLVPLQNAGKPVLVIEYAQSTKSRDHVQSSVKGKPLITLITDRELKTLGTLISEVTPATTGKAP